jgi:hypothetical protein
VLISVEIGHRDRLPLVHLAKPEIAGGANVGLNHSHFAERSHDGAIALLPEGRLFEDNQVFFNKIVPWQTHVYSGSVAVERAHGFDGRGVLAANSRSKNRDGVPLNDADCFGRACLCMQSDS